MKTDEKRMHARLQGSMDVEIGDANGVHKAKLRDLSQGGACLVVSSQLVPINNEIALFLPGVYGARKAALKARLIKSRASEGGFICGIQFIETGASNLAAVDYLLGVLFRGGGNDSRRDHPRVSRRIMVRCESPAELLAMVENISLGGLSIVVEEKIELGESLLVVLPGDDGQDLLSLTGTVANLREVPDSDPVAYLAGLKFKEMTPQRLTMLDTLLTSMLRFT